MSKMKELYDKVSADKVLQEEFFRILNDAEKTGEEATKESLVQFAKGEGFEITVEEMNKFFKELTKKEQNELSTAELDMVAGGKGMFGLFLSVGSMGIGCAVTSLVMEMKHLIEGAYSCDRLLNMDLADPKN